VIYAENSVDLLAKVRTTLGITAELLAVERTISSSPRYTLITSRGRVDLGTKRWISRPAEFRASVCDAIGEMPNLLRGTAWSEVCQSIRQAAELIDLGADATDEGLGREWLREYVSNLPKKFDDTDSYAPIWDKGDLLISGNHLRNFVDISYNEKVSRARMALILRAAGCRPKKCDRIINGHRFQHDRWLVPLYLSLGSQGARAQID
jgi:hypothetical protein